MLRGWSTYRIGETVGFSESAIRRQLTKAGIPLRGNGRFCKPAEPIHGHGLPSSWHPDLRQELLDRAEAWSRRDRANRQTRAKRLRGATLPWANMDALAAIYAEAKRLTAETGVQHHVDHILPLNGHRVCGLHVPENLRVVPAWQNMQKGRYSVYDRGRSSYRIADLRLEHICSNMPRWESDSNIQPDSSPTTTRSS